MSCQIWWKMIQVSRPLNFFAAVKCELQHQFTDKNKLPPSGISSFQIIFDFFRTPQASPDILGSGVGVTTTRTGGVVSTAPISQHTSLGYWHSLRKEEQFNYFTFNFNFIIYLAWNFQLRAIVHHQQFINRISPIEKNIRHIPCYYHTLCKN